MGVCLSVVYMLVYFIFLPVYIVKDERISSVHQRRREQSPDSQIMLLCLTGVTV